MANSQVESTMLEHSSKASNAAQAIAPHNSCHDCSLAVRGIHRDTRNPKLICTFYGREAIGRCQHYLPSIPEVPLQRAYPPLQTSSQADNWNSVSEAPH